MFTLSSYRKAIEHKSEIREAVREEFTVFDYMVSLKDTFDSDEARNARGIIFSNETEEIISLPYDKFHNLGECPGWMESDINMMDSHVVLEKLDGSMIRSIPMKDGSYRLGTRAGITDVSIKTEKYLKLVEDSSMQYQEFILSCITNEYTCIFEYCAPDNQIVIYYQEPQLILTGIRSNINGKYIKYDIMSSMARINKIPCVKQIANETTTISELAEIVKPWPVDEGVVVRFESGKMIKIKALDYVLKHKALDGLRFEKDVIRIIIDNKIDDVLSIVDEKMKIRLEDYQNYIIKNVMEYNFFVEKLYSEIKERTTDRKEFALEASKFSRSNLLFLKYSDRYDLNAVILKNCGSQTDVNSMRDIIGNKTFYEFN